MADIIKLTAKGLYSTDMRGKSMTACSSYQQILIINNQSTELFNFASLGFYKTGQLLNRAKKDCYAVGKLFLKDSDVPIDTIYESAQCGDLTRSEWPEERVGNIHSSVMIP